MDAPKGILNKIATNLHNFLKHIMKRLEEVKTIR